MNQDTYGTKSRLQIGQKNYEFYDLTRLEKAGIDVGRLPYSLRILLENLLRHEDGVTVTRNQIDSVLHWNPKSEPNSEIAFRPGRVLLQDFTGVPAVVDLAAMRDAMVKLGGSPSQINPLQPAELVIDHSVQVDYFGTLDAFRLNNEKEFERNRERYVFLRWGQKALRNFRVVPPSTGIVHQVNLEFLGRVVMEDETSSLLYPDTVVGTDSHTTMINGLGILGWGVGGIEAEAAMLGQPISMLLPQVVGFELSGSLREGTTATDLVLRVVEMLRAKGVVGKFVEFYGAGLSSLSLADRATISNMAPEYGATCGIFPIDAVTLHYLRLTGRSEATIARVETYAKAQGFFHDTKQRTPEFSDTLYLDLSTVEPSLAGPKRPQDRVSLSEVKTSFEKVLPTLFKNESSIDVKANVSMGDHHFDLHHGSVVIAAITSCTNTSNPSVMLGAGLLAKKAAERGLTTKPWVKTSLAPGSKVVTDYLNKAGLTPYLNQLRFHLTGYGCTTCIGNSGPLPEQISTAIHQNQLIAVSVLSGNRNFEGRINPDVRANYLASPPLVVAYALAGRVNIDFEREPIGKDKAGNDVFLRDIWPSTREVEDTIHDCVQSEMFQKSYSDVFEGDEEWKKLAVPEGETYTWDPDSTYVKSPPYFENMKPEPEMPKKIESAHVLALLGDSITTDHISPAGSIAKDSPAGKYLQQNGISPMDFNSYGARRGNHEVMVRGTFANIRLKNQLTPGKEGSWTKYLPTGEEMSIFDASVKYQQVGIPLIVIAGSEYGTGSSRDWAAKGPALLGVKAVIAQSFERIHRSNLIGMGILPLQFINGQNAKVLGLDGTEVYTIHGMREGIEKGFKDPKIVHVEAVLKSGQKKMFDVQVRIDTPKEILYYVHGGILPYVLRQLKAVDRKK